MKRQPPTLLVDTREQRPLYFGDSPVRVCTLPTGDYSVEGLTAVIAIERKSLSDLFGTVGAGRERFEREVERAASLKYFGIFVEATFDEVLAGAPRSRMNPISVIASLHCWELKCPNLHVQYLGSRKNVAALTRKLLYKMAEYEEDAKTPPVVA